MHCSQTSDSRGGVVICRNSDSEFYAGFPPFDTNIIQVKVILVVLLWYIHHANQ